MREKMASFHISKQEGRDLANEMIVREGYDSAHSYFTRHNPFPTANVKWAGWFGFFDVLAEKEP